MNKDKFIIGGVLVAIVLATFALFSRPVNNIIREITHETKLGGETNLNTICTGEGSQVCASVARGTLETSSGVSTGTATWLNTSGQDVIIDLVEMYPTRKATSTMFVWAATSTQATSTISDYRNPEIEIKKNVGNGKDSLGFPTGGIGIGGYLIASTSVATGTRPVIISRGMIFRNDAQDQYANQLPGDYQLRATTTLATTTVILKSLERIIFGIRGAGQACGGSASNSYVGDGVLSSSCESATSTNRDPYRWNIFYHYQL